MIEIKNLRIEDMDNGWSRAIADIAFTEMQSSCDEKHIWFATRRENRGMLSDDSYDAFLLVPLYLAMYHKQELHIRGNVSKQLYKNIMTYVQTILCDFSDALSKVNVFVDGYKEEKTDNPFITGEKRIIGAGISCGVDSLSTIYDHFINEDDPEYEINALFLVNCGTHGDYKNPKTFELYENRYNLNKKAADEMGLPVYQVNSNLHAFFRRQIGEQKVVYFAIYSCVLAFEKAIKKYYVSSGDSYEEIKAFGKYKNNFDMAGFCDSYLVPLIRTENCELLIDGCQYKRTEKTERISDWEIATKDLNVCVHTEDGRNCSRCSKCMRTLIPLDAMGKLEKFSGTFDLNVYCKYAFRWKCLFKADYAKNNFANDIVNFCGVHGYPLPTALITKPFGLLHKNFIASVADIARDALRTS